VAATTKGSIADRTCEASVFATSDTPLGFVPNESNDTFPSLLCHPTRPMNGVVEHANADSEPPWKLLECFEYEQEEEEEEEE